jgi:hypothetical protein
MAAVVAAVAARAPAVDEVVEAAPALPLLLGAAAAVALGLAVSPVAPAPCVALESLLAHAVLAAPSSRQVAIRIRLSPFFCTTTGAAPF